MLEFSKRGLARFMPAPEYLKLEHELEDAFADICETVEEIHEVAHKIETRVNRVLFGEDHCPITDCCSPGL